MPPKPLKPCTKCGKLTTSVPCDACRKSVAAAYDRARGTATARGYDSRWARYSKRYRIEHPLCVHCLAEGVVHASEHVDHIEAVSGPDDPLFWDPRNHQALCRRHHSLKTAKEDGRWGK